MPQLFLDLDGVLADFDAGYEANFGVRPCKKADNVEWPKIRGTPNFYRDLPPMADALDLWNATKNLNPIILTGIPASIAEAADNKRAWVFKNLGPDVDVICCRSADKARFCVPGDILVDDWDKYQDRWLAARGVFVLHVSAAKSIAELQKFGVLA